MQNAVKAWLCASRTCRSGRAGPAPLDTAYPLLKSGCVSILGGTGAAAPGAKRAFLGILHCVFIFLNVQRDL